jgi:hypothetical protein
MPRNGSGTYNLPAGNPVVGGTTIASGWANTTLSDLASALTGSVSTDGQSAMTAPLLLSAGSVSLPSLSRTGDPNTGLFFPAADQVALAAGGVQKVTLDSTRLSVGLSGAALQNQVRVYGHSTADMSPVVELYRFGTVAAELHLAGSYLGVSVNAAGTTDAQLAAAETARFAATHTSLLTAVGIGFTATPTSYGGGFRMLEVKGSTTTDGGVVRMATSDASIAADYFTSSSFGGAVLRTTTNHPFKFNVNSSTTVLTLTTAGNAVVGPGASTGSRFEVNIGSAALVESKVLNTVSTLAMGVAASGAASVQNSAAQAMTLGTAAGTALTFTSGNVTQVAQDLILTKATAPTFGPSANVDLVVQTNSTEKLRLTADGRLYGTALHNNAGAVTGTTNQYIASGTYTPTLTNGTNIASSGSNICQWKRVGNVVTVSGSISAACTAANTASQLDLSLPIASNFTNNIQLAGFAAPNDNSIVTYPCYFQSDSTNDRASMLFRASKTASGNFSFVFQYEVL